MFWKDSIYILNLLLELPNEFLIKSQQVWNGKLKSVGKSTAERYCHFWHYQNLWPISHIIERIFRDILQSWAVKVLVMIIIFMFSRFGGFLVSSCLVFSCTVLMYPNLFLVGLSLFSCISTIMVKPPGSCGHHHCANHGLFLSLSFNSTLWQNLLTKKQLIEVSIFLSCSQRWRLCWTGNSGMCSVIKFKSYDSYDMTSIKWDYQWFL